MEQRTYTEEFTANVVDRLLSGESPASVSNELKIPLRTVKSWQQKHHTPKATQRREKLRGAFQVVLDTHSKIRSTIGTSKAIDYSRNTGGQGAQYSRSDIGHQLIDFVVDVDKAAKDTLTPTEHKFFEENLTTGDYDPTVQSSSFLRLQERLGSVFVARGLYPTSGYFKPVGRGR